MRMPQRKHSVVEEQIEEAVKRGDFDNLKGRGRPLNLQGDLSNAKTMGQKLRRDAGFGAPWQDVEAEIAGLERAIFQAAQTLLARRATLKRAGADEARIAAETRTAREAIEAQLRAANSLILKYNLIIPPLLPHLHRARLKWSDFGMRNP